MAFLDPLYRNHVEIWSTVWSLVDETWNQRWLEAVGRSWNLTQILPSRVRAVFAASVARGCQPGGINSKSPGKQSFPLFCPLTSNLPPSVYFLVVLWVWVSVDDCKTPGRHASVPQCHFQCWLFSLCVRSCLCIWKCQIYYTVLRHLKV